MEIPVSKIKKTISSFPCHCIPIFSLMAIVKMLSIFVFSSILIFNLRDVFFRVEMLVFIVKIFDLKTLNFQHSISRIFQTEKAVIKKAYIPFTSD